MTTVEGWMRDPGPVPERDRNPAPSSAALRTVVEEHPPTQTDWVSAFLEALFAAFDDGGIRWLVPRNHLDLPDRVGHDVDIVVHPADSRRAGPHLRRVVHDRGLILLRDYTGLEHHTFDLAEADLRGRLVLHVDIQTGLQYRGRMLVDAEDLLRCRRRAGVWWVPTPAMEAYVLLLHTALHKRELKPKYARRFTDLVASDRVGFIRFVSQRIGPRLADAAAGVRTEADLLALRGALSRAVDRRYRSNHVRRGLFTVKSSFRQARLRLRPRGVFIVFLGPDGSGKTSTTDLLAQLLGGHGDVLPIHRVYMGSGQPILPTRRLVRRLRGKTGPRAERKPAVVRDVAPRRLRGALHVMIDEVARFWIQVRPRLAPHGIVLADRYVYDILRINNQTVHRSWFRRLVVGIAPAPDITFLLEGDPQVVAARKRELTVDETIRQQAAYRALEGVVAGFTAIDLTRRDDATLRRVALTILQIYARRNQGFMAPMGASDSSNEGL